MKEQRMTIEELRELEEQGKLPVVLTLAEEDQNHLCGNHDEVIAIRGTKVVCADVDGDAFSLSFPELRHYKSLREEPKTEWLYECLAEMGGVEYFFSDGSYPIFENKRRSANQYPECIARKTGRKIKINMETFDLVGEVVSEG